MYKKLAYQLRACGNEGLPPEITHSGMTYKLARTFKHDFFAATGLYESNNHSSQQNSSPPEKLVLKIGRRNHFLGLPLAWFGRHLCRREVNILNKLADMQQVPKPLSPFGSTGFIYPYIEGKTLSSTKDIPADFFDKLDFILSQLHRHNIFYVDMNKRDNIILGDDGRPYIIDFQISQFVDQMSLVLPPLSKSLRGMLARADRYHLLKHKRRLCPHLLTEEEEQLSHSRAYFLIRLHRIIATPWRKIRRRFLDHVNHRAESRPHQTQL